MSRNQRLAAVRLILHDCVCQSDWCPGGGRDHARRTQHSNAREIVDAATPDEAKAVAFAVVWSLFHPSAPKVPLGRLNPSSSMYRRLAEALDWPDDPADADADPA